jgi:hypothetical protein
VTSGPYPDLIVCLLISLKRSIIALYLEVLTALERKWSKTSPEVQNFNLSKSSAPEVTLLENWE